MLPVPRRAMRADKAKKAEQGKQKKKWKTVLPYVTLVLGIFLMALPVFTDMSATWQAEQVISTMESKPTWDKDPERLEQKEQAEAYNTALAFGKPKIKWSKIWKYEKQLTWQTPYIGWIEIPSVNISLPIYHGTSDEVLAAGAGHVKGTSLPVGGEPSNCCVSAHSGMQTARMFDDIRLLHAGDKICVHALSEPYAYEVVSSETVLPEEKEHLSIYSKKYKDMLTLITCTPIGINDHRILVHCKRIPYDPADFETVPASAYLNTRTIPLLVAGLALIAFAALVLLLERRRREKKKERLEAERLEAAQEAEADEEVRG